MCLGDSVPPRPAGQSPLVWLTISVMLVTIIIGGVVMGSLYTDNTNLSHRDIKLPALTILVVVDKSTEIVGNSHAGVSE